MADSIGTYRMFLPLSKGRVRGQQALILSQPPNREPDDVNHTEPELFLQALNEMQVRVREANCRRLKSIFLHTLNSCRRAIGLSLPESIDEKRENRQLRDIFGVSPREEFL